jgi:hypothetical protein
VRGQREEEREATEEAMATREKFLELAWKEVINAPMLGAWIDNDVEYSRRNPDAPFADLGPALKRLLECGADRRDLSLIARHAAYEAVFQILFMLDDPGVDNDNNKMMYESLLGADPSGKEGRPGSAP